MSYKTLDLYGAKGFFRINGNGDEIQNKFNESLVFLKMMGFSVKVQESSREVDYLFDNKEKSFVLNITKDNENNVRSVGVVCHGKHKEKMMNLFLEDRNVDVGEKRIGYKRITYAKSYLKDGMLGILEKMKRM